MVRHATLATLAQLEQEMERAGRDAEVTALGEARRVLAQPHHGLLTTGQAAERLGVSIPTVKRWVEHGSLEGSRIEGRWLVSSQSVDQLVGIRDAVRQVVDEGLPSDEELQELITRAPASVRE